jgi:hypothetical protein
MHKGQIVLDGKVVQKTANGSKKIARREKIC